MEIENKIEIQQHESIKLSKMSKGYQWEIKVLDLDVDRLIELDNKLREKFPPILQLPD